MPRAAFVAAPIAFLATASAVTLGVLASNPDPRDLIGAQDASASISGSREGAVSRSDSRLDAPVDGQVLHRALGVDLSPAATARAIRDADTELWTTTALNLWSSPTEGAAEVGEIDSGKKVLLTGRNALGRDEIVVDGEARWVTEGYLTDEKPVTAPAGLSTAPCPDSSVESGLTSDAVYVYRSVCHAFPQITTYGGWDAHGEHSSGKALDIMTTDKALGDQIAAFLQDHASELNLYDVIWWDQIWTPERASEGWRYYGDYGSATANHMDHVHVSTN
jgi:hypothetical protein